MKKQIILVTLMIVAAWAATAQQQPMYTQYMFNGLALNPAYAGSHESLSLTALSRFQWVGVDGAPTTHTFSAHSPIPGRQIAVGLLFSNDQIGVTSQNSLFASYAYRIDLGNSVLSLGLQAGLRNADINFSELSVNDPNLESAFSSFKPNFGIGAYWYSQRFYAGLSVPTALKNKWGANQDVLAEANVYTDIQHYFATAGMLLDFSPTLKLKPSILIKSVAGAPMEIDLNANLILDDKVWVGLSYRSFDAISLLFDLQISPQLRFGYSYDYAVTGLREVTSGSHELMLNYRFVFSKTKIVTPRYF